MCQRDMSQGINDLAILCEINKGWVIMESKMVEVKSGIVTSLALYSLVQVRRS